MGSTVSKIATELSQNNMTVLDASVLSPMIRRVMQEQQDQFMQRLEQTLLQQKVYFQVHLNLIYVRT